MSQLEQKNLKELFSEIVPYKEIKVSTKTVIAVSNLIFDLNLLYNYLCITDYVVPLKKRGRKSKIETVDPNKDIKPGSIITVQYKTNIRGAIIKKKKESKNTFFLNSITLIVVLDEGKMLNVKVSKNGKFQITGCKEDSHFLKCIEYIYKNVKESEELIGEKMCKFKNNNKIEKQPTLNIEEKRHEKENVIVIFNIVMNNKDFKCGFSIQRDLVDTHFNMNTNFTSHFEAQINPGVNIKLKNPNFYDTELHKIEIVDSGNKSSVPDGRSTSVWIDLETRLSKTDKTEYISYLDEKEKKKDAKKPRYHTFLVFCSGSIIQSGSGPDMDRIYREFMEILLKHKEEFIEKLGSTVIETKKRRKKLKE